MSVCACVCVYMYMGVCICAFAARRACMRACVLLKERIYIFIQYES